MSFTTSERISSIPFSNIREIFEEAKRMEKLGSDIIHMEIGRPDFDTPEHIKKAANLALENGHVHYTSNNGIMELREAIAQKLWQENKIKIDPENEVAVSIGCKEAIFNTVFAFINPGDEVLIQDPSWLEYQYIVKLAGGIPVPIPLYAEDGFVMNPEILRQNITNKTRMMIINSPHNPTGSVLPKNVLEEIASIAIEYDLLVISDEIYEKLIYDDSEHVSLASLPGMFERTVTINGFSKAYAMDGWRLGYAAGHVELMKPIVKMHQYNTSSATSFAQYGAVEAYKGSQEDVNQMVKEFDKRRKFMMERIKAMPLTESVNPSGAFYIFPSFKKTGLSSVEMAKRILTEVNIACVPGSAFGEQGEGHIRFAYSTSMEEIKKGMDRLEEFLVRF
ncbi:pyridoxal phosphate-dependent aminotransferase [Niallia nealsonii]|uniref:Aminotransferase n=1 Tax=Niallia nealsonii TaxID=115979 RepID=A0A2N0Z5H9_9BACI|nr:pyridoxal phosphate-dependent aminotransferase [Niallia nealsonii]PKG24763.1 pyridoxal phosphate-dependent aminotransferase [Niallia nealsonii]